MHRHALFSLASCALLAAASCGTPADGPAAEVAVPSPAGVDAAIDRASPVILSDAFSAPRSDAKIDVSMPAPQPPSRDSGSTPDATPVDAGAARADTRIADSCSLDCGEAAVWKPREQCDGPADGHSPDAADARGLVEASTDTSPGADVAADTGPEADVAADTGPEADAPRPAADHLIITEVVARPGGAEMIEIFNPTPSPVDLSDHALSDSHQYFMIATGSFSTASGSDFVAFFPAGSQLPPGSYRTVSIANGSGGQQSFESTYGKKPDFELRPTANGAIDDPEVPNMQPAAGISSIGAVASLTDGGEPVVLFRYASGNLVYDVDYVFYGAVSAANPAIDKTGAVVNGSAYLSDRAASLQKPAAAPSDGGALHRCSSSEADELEKGGNGTTCHDETSEDFSAAFVRSANQRTPGEPPPAGLCP